eukprot:190793-Pleurochrysis_carterae.AAC.2
MLEAPESHTERERAHTVLHRIPPPLPEKQRSPASSSWSRGCAPAPSSRPSHSPSAPSPAEHKRVTRSAGLQCQPIPKPRFKMAEAETRHLSCRGKTH